MVLLFLLCQFPARRSLLALNYHRIGDPDANLFKPCVFSATADELDRQVAYLKRHLSMATLEEALSFIDGSLTEKTNRCRVLMTFDDGYPDNYSDAYPVMKSHGVQGVFFWPRAYWIPALFHGGTILHIC